MVFLSRLSPVVLAFFLVSEVYAQKSATSEEQQQVKIECTKDQRLPSAWYVGPYKGYDSNLSGLDLARDLYCADLYKRTRFPNGFVTIFGSSKISEFFEQPSTAQRLKNMSQAMQEFNRTYAEVKNFAFLWAGSEYGKKFPILTGAGPGLMEAGSRGAFDAGLSVGYTTYYTPAKQGEPHAYTDVPEFWRYEVPGTGSRKEVTSEGLIFSSVSTRETAMILHSAAIVIAPGGSGTEWEIFQVVEMLKSKQLKPVPVYFIGEKYHWNSLIARIEDMEQRGTIKKGSIPVEFAACPLDLMNKIGYKLNLTANAPVASTEACAASKRLPYEVNTFKQLNLVM